ASDARVSPYTTLFRSAADLDVSSCALEFSHVGSSFGPGDGHSSIWSRRYWSSRASATTGPGVSGTDRRCAEPSPRNGDIRDRDVDRLMTLVQQDRGAARPPLAVLRRAEKDPRVPVLRPHAQLEFAAARGAQLLDRCGDLSVERRDEGCAVACGSGRVEPLIGLQHRKLEAVRGHLVDADAAAVESGGRAVVDDRDDGGSIGDAHPQRT